jgi:hypothetical protein
MRPDPEKRAEALSRLAWTPPDEDELQRLEATHKPEMWRLLGVGLIVGLGLGVANGILFGVDWLRLVYIGQAVTLAIASCYGVVSDMCFKAAWKPLARTEVEDLFGERMLRFGSLAHPHPKVKRLRRLTGTTARACVVVLVIWAVVISVWIVKSNPAKADLNSRQSNVIDASVDNRTPLKVMT